MTTVEAIASAGDVLGQLPGHIFDVITVTKPTSPSAAVNLARVVSKLSPMVGNLIEFNTCEFLNEKGNFVGIGRWERQDPGFPDIILNGTVKPVPGFEVKAWYPLATEMTGRFKDSRNHFLDDRTYVALIAWIPEFLIYGRPKIIDVAIASGASVAHARDAHYHNPPDYLVVEPGDSSKRTKNLQQTNTAGYVWQSVDDPVVEQKRRLRARRLWNSFKFKSYSTDTEYQAKVRRMMANFDYRLDTNYAKLDRIGHAGVESFADRVLKMDIQGMTIRQWSLLLSKGTKEAQVQALADKLSIEEVDTSKALIK